MELEKKRKEDEQFDDVVQVDVNMVKETSFRVNVAPTQDIISTENVNLYSSYSTKLTQSQVTGDQQNSSESYL